MVKVTTGYIAVSKTTNIAIHINELKDKKEQNLTTRSPSTSTTSSDSFSDTESESSDFSTSLSSFSSHFSEEDTRYFSDTDEETNDRFEQDSLKLKERNTTLKSDNDKVTKENKDKLHSRSFIGNVRSHSSIDLLHSPKLSRKNISHSNRDISKSTMTLTNTNSRSEKKQKSYTSDVVRGDIEKDDTGDGESRFCRSCPAYLFSPNIKRKQIDITSSPAYKEIYAHNIRLYSAVLAKQIAGTGQVGREMDELRRNKIKQKALNITKKTPKFQRSKSCSPTDMRRLTADDVTVDDVQKDTFSASQKSTDELMTVKDCKINETGLTLRMAELPKRRSKSLLETQSEVSSDVSINDCLLKKSQQRHKDALLRAEHCRKKLESFDITIQQADLFLEKCKKQH